MAERDQVINPIVTAHIKGYKQGPLIAERMAPTVVCDAHSVQVLKFGREDFEEVDDSRVPGADATQVEVGRYDPEPVAIPTASLDMKVIKERQTDAQVVGVDYQRMAATSGLNRMLLKREIQSAALFHNPANYPAGNVDSISGTDRWDDPSGGTPLEQINDNSSVVRLGVGVRPTTLQIGGATFDALKSNAKIREHFKHTNNSSITLDMMRTYFGVDEILVGDATKWNGSASVDVWGKHALLFYKAAPATQQDAGALQPFMNAIDYTQVEPSAFYTYTMRGHPMVSMPWWNQPPRSWMVPVDYDRKPIVSCNEAVVLLENVIN